MDTDATNAPVDTFAYQLNDNAKMPISGIKVVYDVNNPSLISGFDYIDEAGNSRHVDTTVDGEAYDEIAYDTAYRQYERDKIDYDSDGVEYEYYSTDRTKKIEFKVVNGVIAKITCKIND